MSASDEVDNATGEAPAKADVLEVLKEKRQALNEARERYATAKTMRDEVAMGDETRLIDALKELIPILEQDASVVLEAAGRKAAEDRLLGIRRSYGSAISTYQDDETRVQQAVTALGEAIKTLNGRARKLEALKAEAAALADRFELAAPSLAIVNEPQLNFNESLPAPWQYRVVRPSFESCEHNLRQRRDYTEISGSPGYAVIQSAGLRPFRPLTEREREVLYDGEEEQKVDPVLAAAAVEATALGQLGVPGGHVHRG